MPTSDPMDFPGIETTVVDQAPVEYVDGPGMTEITSTQTDTWALPDDYPSEESPVLE
jgi:hypothetical protein